MNCWHWWWVVREHSWACPHYWHWSHMVSQTAGLTNWSPSPLLAPSSHYPQLSLSLRYREDDAILRNGTIYWKPQNYGIPASSILEFGWHKPTSYTRTHWLGCWYHQTQRLIFFSQSSWYPLTNEEARFWLVWQWTLLSIVL